MYKIVTKQRYTNFIISIGAMLEYYDYVVFALLAKYISKSLLPNIDNSILINFLFFSFGKMCRPVGGLISGYLADKYSSKNIVILIALIMSIATIIMGCLPQHFGDYTNLIILFVLRILQSLTFAAEIPCAATYLYQQQSTNIKKGINASLIFSYASLGSLLATGTLAFLTFHLIDSEIVAWGWRIPILIGGSLGLVIFIFRLKIDQNSASSNNVSIKTVLQNFNENKKHLILSILLISFPASLVSSHLYFSKYFSTIYSVGSNFIYLAQTIGMAVGCVFAPLSGWIYEKIGYEKVLPVVYIGFLTTIIAWNKLIYDNIWSLVMFMIIW